jgi:hypothetical protein
MWANFLEKIMTNKKLLNKYGLGDNKQLFEIYPSICILFSNELREMLKAKIDSLQLETENTNIASVSFAYNNSRVIKLLTKKRNLIVNQSKMKKQVQIDMKLDEL